MQTFEQLLAERGGPPSAWHRKHSRTEFCAYLDATMEAFDLADGALLVGARLSFRGDVAINYLGECEAPQGSSFHALSFQLGDDLEVIQVIETDGHHAGLAYRGDRESFVLIAVELRMFEGRCFEHLRDDQAAA